MGAVFWWNFWIAVLVAVAVAIVIAIGMWMRWAARRSGGTDPSPKAGASRK
jgi:heme/copper-type cytochrome/quinol oxidase subunit 2